MLTLNTRKIFARLVLGCLILSISLELFACAHSTTLEDQASQEEVLNYFYDIALGAEFGNEAPSIHKWTDTLKVFKMGQWPDYLSLEFEAILAELKPLLNGLSIEQVTTRAEANYLIFIGDPAEYVQQIEAAAADYVDANYGMFWMNWDDDTQAYTQGNMYVDPLRANTPEWQKHLLREEFTQSLGLMKDSDQYPGSIFYGKYSLTTEYSQLDRELIKLLYRWDVKPGMTASELVSILE